MADGSGSIRGYEPWGSPSIAPEDGVTASRTGEIYLLAALLCSPQNFEHLPEGFDSRHFVTEDHGDIFDAAREAARAGASKIFPRVEMLLPHMAGPTGYIRQLVASLISARPNDARAYAETLMDFYERRMLIETADNIRAEVMKPMADRQPTTAVISRAAAMLDTISAGQRTSKPAMTLGEAARDAIAAGQAAYQRGDGLSGISTGFRSMDLRLGGLEGGSVYALGGRPGMGKTGLAVAMALRMAEDGVPVGMISLEMKARQIGRRALSLRTPVHLADIKGGKFVTNTEWASALVGAQRAFDDVPFLIEDEPSLTVAAIKLRAKAMRRRLGGLGVLIIDHLHIVGKGEGGARHGDTQAITEISAGIKGIAKDMDIPILLLAQLSRGPENREDKRPSLADLRQSGSIEQDVDAAMFIYRPDYYFAKTMSDERKMGEGDERYHQRMAEQREHMDAIRGVVEIISDKVRDGETGTDFIRFDGKRTRFYEEGDTRA